MMPAPSVPGMLAREGGRDVAGDRLSGSPAAQGQPVRPPDPPGREPIIEQDRAVALRIPVDIAIRALSPAVNDPTTAVQVLDYIEDLLLVMGRRELGGQAGYTTARVGSGSWSRCATGSSTSTWG
jgi:Predicted membrane protein (DUF2254)